MDNRTKKQVEDLEAMRGASRITSKSVRIDTEVLEILNNRLPGRTPNQTLRWLFNLPARNYNRPRKKRNRIIRIFRILLRGK